jgi:hypothetical protein
MLIIGLPKKAYQREVIQKTYRFIRKHAMSFNVVGLAL